MARDEAKGRGDETKTNARVRAETSEAVPLVSAKRGKFETLTNTKIEAIMYARLTDYKSFVCELEGEEPEDGAVISAGLEMLFGADKGFERWVSDARKKSRNGANANHNHTADNAATTIEGEAKRVSAREAQT